MSVKMTETDRCRACGASLDAPFYAPGDQTLVNAYAGEAPRFPIAVACCRRCGLVQLVQDVDPELLFSEYAYETSTSPQLVDHFSEYSDELELLVEDRGRALVVDVGSNDGLLLRRVRRWAGAVLGVDPARNVAQAAASAGVETVPEMFSRAVAREIVVGHGRAGAVTANNVLAHVADPVDFVRAVGDLLSNDGVFVVQVQDVEPMLALGEFTSVYHEHRSYFSLRTLVDVVRRGGLEVFDVEQVPVQGWSLRAFAAVPGRRAPTSTLLAALGAGGDGGQTCAPFPARVARSLERIAKLVERATRGGRRCVGYGASARASALLQVAGFGVEYVVDESRRKQGASVPGTGVGVYPVSRLRERDRDAAVLVLVWNYAESILRKEGTLTGPAVIPFHVPRAA